VPNTYVLVAGAWLGGWAWHWVASTLRANQHAVFPATLTGLGERVHLARPDVDLETHIQDVVNLITYEDLSEVVLVGHSYAAIVVTGVADRVPERLRGLVYCDAAPLVNGQRFVDLMGSPEGEAQLREVVDRAGDGWRFPFPGFPALGNDASVRGLGDAEQALMQARAVAQPFATYTQPLRLSRPPGPVPYQRIIIQCDDARQFVPYIRQALAAGDPTYKILDEPDWRFVELDTGHWPMLSEPERLAQLLMNG
jgi:pimeloyl-ACP methyl ester carboxylesterase